MHFVRSFLKIRIIDKCQLSCLEVSEDTAQGHGNSPSAEEIMRDYGNDLAATARESPTLETSQLGIHLTSHRIQDVPKPFFHFVLRQK